MVAKQLTAVVNLTVAVDVTHQQTVVLSNPAAVFPKTVSVMVKINSCPRTGSFDLPVPVQINNQRRTRLLCYTE